MLGKFMHPQLIDNVSMGLIARFNIKAEPKDVAKFIFNFGGGQEDDELIPSGFPIGKIQSQEHFDEIKKNQKEGMFYNVVTGKSIKGGNPTMYYGDGWCAKRNSPAHQALVKLDTDDSEKSIEIDEKDGWAVVKDSNYIWSTTLEKIIGRLKNSKPLPLSQKSIEIIKASNDYEWERLSEDELIKHKLPK